MAITIRLNGVERVIRKLNRAAATRGIVTRDVLEGIGFRAVRSVQRGIREQRSPDGAPYKPVSRFGAAGERLRDTSRLLKSITYQVEGDRVVVGTNVVYAATQHFGDPNRRAKNAKYLAIPLTRQVARAVAGRGYREAFPHAFVFKSANGNLLLARKNASEGLDLLAVLKKSVRIQGTHFLGLSKAGEADILGYLERTIGKIVEGGD